MGNDMPGVYKSFMVRMFIKTDESTNVQVLIVNYGNIDCQWSKVKFTNYEILYIWQAYIELAGLQQKPKKENVKDRIQGTWKSIKHKMVLAKKISKFIYT